MGGVDLATLGIKVDSTDAKGAASDLDKLTAAGARTEKATDSLGAAHRKSAGEVKSATAAAEQLTQRWTGMAGAIGVLGSALAALGLASMVQQIVETNKEFQSLQASLKISAGSAEAATAAFDEIKKFASETPFALDQSVKAFIKLKNLGLDPSTEAMRSYGNTAASMGKDLNDMIEAVADASTGEFERLKEFGIKAAVEGNKVAFTFQGATTSIGNNSKEIQTYLRNIGDVQFAGAMAEQMNTLSGQAANLGDALESAFVAFGEGGFNAALSEALQSMTGAAAGAEGLAGQLGALAGDAVRMAADFVKTVAPAFRFVAENLGTIFKLGTSAAIGIGALRAVMVVGGIVQYASAAVGLAASLGGVSAASVIATAATTAMAAAARGLLLALGPIGIALTAAAIAYEYLSDNADGAANSTETARETLNRLKKEANETAPATNALGGALQMAQSEMLTAAEKARALIAQLYGVKFAALQAAAALAQADVMKAWSKVNRANESDLRSPFAVMMGVDFGKTRADVAEYKSAVGELSAANKVAQIAEDAVAKAHSNAAAEAKKMMDAANAAAPKVEKLGASHDKAGKAAKAAKPPVDELAKAYEALQRSVNDVERALEEMWSYKPPQEGPTDFIQQGVAEIEKVIADIEDRGDLAFKIKTEISAESTENMMRALRDISDAANDAADAMASAFGRVGGAIGQAAAILSSYGEEQERIKSTSKTAAEEERRLTQLQVNSVGMLLGTAKTLFKEHSAGYRAMAAAEKAFAVVQLANTAINVAAGASKMFASLGPLGFPAVAAMLAVMAALGFAGGSGGGGYTPPTADDLQKANGTGSVLGDDTAKSASIANSLALMLKNSNKDLEYSNDAVAALRSIDAGIGGLTAALARQLNLSGGAFDTSNMGLGTVQSGSGIIGALFGTKTKTELFDQGIQFFSTTVADVINQGIDALTYNVVQTTKKKKFLGVTVGGGTSYNETTADLDNALERQFELIIKDVRNGVVAAADTLGLGLASELVNNITISMNKLSLKDLNGEEIQAELEAFFSKIADDLAGSTLDALTNNGYTGGAKLADFQRAGEGLFETLQRLAREFLTVDSALKSIGMSAWGLDKAFSSNNNPMTTAKSREELIGLFGGLDQFAEQVGAFREAFLTEAEQMAPVIDSVRAEMARLGLAGVATNDQFKSLVLGLDLSTTAGQEMFASLLAVAPAFNKVTEYLGSLDAELGNAGKTAAELAAIAKQSRSLDIALMEALGNASGALAAKRADELAALDESLRAKQAEVWAAQDAAQAAKELASATEAATRASEILANQRRNLEITVMELLGDASGALAARRADELAALDPSLRALQERINALQDMKTAEEAAAAASQALAEAEAQAAEQRRAIAEQRVGLEIELLRAQGQETAAVAAEREREIAALDESLRSIKLAIFAAQDLAAAHALEEEAARSAAALVTEIATQRRDLEIRMMEATGDSAGALAARRADELAAMDESLRAYAQLVWAAEDAAAAIGGVTDALQLAKQAADLNIRLLDAQGQSEAALAARRAQELAATDVSLQATLQAIYAAEDAAKAQALQAEATRAAAATAAEVARAQQQAAEEAARAAAELASKRSSLEIELMRALGNEAGAVAAQRQLELAAMDSSLRALQRQVWAEQDAATARDAAAKAIEEANAEAERRAQAAADLARTRRGLEIEIMELTGNAAGALAARRADELAAMDPTLRALQNQIYALTDAADAAERLADAQAEATRIAEEAAAKVIEIEKGRTSLTIALLEAQGNSSAALALRRAEELAATDPLLRALQEQVWATQDAASAAADLAKAQEEAAAKAEQLAKDRMSLEIQLLELQGYTAQATALKRQQELAAMDESLRPLQQLIYAYQDAQVAEEAHAQAVADAADLVEKARSTLTDAYEREAGALQDTINRFTDFGDSLRAFREGLFATDAATAGAYRAAQVKFITTSALAATGNEAALGGLEGVSKTFLDASRANASSIVQYQRDVAAVARSVDAAIGAADEAVDYAQLQLDALNAQVVGILDLNKNFVTFADALQAYLDAQADAATIQDQTPQPLNPVQAPSVQAEQTQAVVASNVELRTEIAALRADLNAALDQIAINTRTSADVLKDADRNGALCIVTDSDTPIGAEVLA